jgi:RNA-directed DNA polymerase
MIDIASRFLDIKNFQRAWQKVAENRGCEGIAAARYFPAF